MDFLARLAGAVLAVLALAGLAALGLAALAAGFGVAVFLYLAWRVRRLFARPSRPGGAPRYTHKGVEVEVIPPPRPPGEDR